MTHDQIIREEFETWCAMRGCAASQMRRSSENPNSYANAEVQLDWITWQAAWAVAEGHAS